MTVLMKLSYLHKGSTEWKNGNVEEHGRGPTITATVKGPRILAAPGMSVLFASVGYVVAYSGDCTTERGIADHLN